jgi:protein TonB
LREGKPAQTAVKVLTAKLAPASVAPAVPAAEVARPPEPPPPSPQAKPQPVTPVPVQTRPSPSAAKAEAAPVAPSAPVTPSAPAAPSSPAPPQAAPAPSAPAATASAAPSAADASARSSDADEAGSRDQYRLALIGAAKRYKRYPAQAMQNGWTGKVEIRLVIGANGMIQSAAVKTSTGYSLLDDTALDMIKKAKPLTQIPPALRGKEFTVDVPVIFDLATG